VIVCSMLNFVAVYVMYGDDSLYVLCMCVFLFFVVFVCVV